MKIALIQTNPLIGDFKRNVANILAWTNKAKAQGCELAIFPEMAICGYPPQDLLERGAFLADHQKALKHLTEQVQGIGLLCGAILHHTSTIGKPLHNGAVLIEDGNILFSAYKRLLPNYDVFDETRYFEPGQASRPFAYKGLNLGITICEDIWNNTALFARQLYPQDPVTDLMENQAKRPDLLINLAASPFHLGKGAIKADIFTNLCTRHQVPILYVNQVGGQDSLLFDGHSMAIDREGKTIAKASRFKEEMAIVDSEDLHGGSQAQSADLADSPDTVLDALVMGTRDYVKKCHFSKVVIGLSGGIDSALTAAIAVRALGAENVQGVAMPSPYSSKESVEDAQELAANLGIDFHILAINNIFDSQLATLEPLFRGLAADVTEQNIQARIRGNLLMALSNKFNAMLLTTGNKSEMAVGYCTLYGDMSGGLAVISDVPKILVYQLAKLVNRDQVLIPERTISKPPSAELAPDQLDQDDLPPYEILDPILIAYLEENKSIQEIVALGFDQEVVADVVRRIKINEYKRKQAPIGLKVTSKAFGYGRRYPITENYSEGRE